MSLPEALALPLEKGAVISHRILEREFDRGANAVGSRVQLDNLDLTVAGVAPEQLDGLYSDQSIDLWILSKGQDLESGADRQNIWALGRLRHGISLAHAQTALDESSAGLVSLPPPGREVELSAKVVSATFFKALDMPVILGRTFSDGRMADGGRAAVINQEAADLYFNDKPLGAAVIDEEGVRTQIVGLVRSQVFGTFEQHAEPTIYFPIRQDPVPA